MIRTQISRKELSAGDMVEHPTQRPADTHQTFELRASGEYLESTTDVPEPLRFKAIVHVSHGTRTHTHEVDFSGGQHQAVSIA
jgi:hypothetical protein